MSTGTPSHVPHAHVVRARVVTLGRFREICVELGLPFVPHSVPLGDPTGSISPRATWGVWIDLEELVEPELCWCCAPRYVWRVSPEWVRANRKDWDDGPMFVCEHMIEID